MSASAKVRDNITSNLKLGPGYRVNGEGAALISKLVNIDGGYRQSGFRIGMIIDERMPFRRLSIIIYLLEKDRL